MCWRRGGGGGDGALAVAAPRLHSSFLVRVPPPQVIEHGPYSWGSQVPQQGSVLQRSTEACGVGGALPKNARGFERRRSRKACHLCGFSVHFPQPAKEGEATKPTR